VTADDHAATEIERFDRQAKDHLTVAKSSWNKIGYMTLRLSTSHRRLVMLSRRTVLNLLVSCGLVIAADAAVAKNQHQKNGHSLLGGKLKQNGRHQIDKAGQAAVSAEVNNGKVTAMSANHPQKGNLPARKVKSPRKLAEIEPGRVRVAANAEGVQFAQVAAYYYAWCFDDGVNEYCYWYPADVVIVDNSWIEYTA
jgi:hypothetical protein